MSSKEFCSAHLLLIFLAFLVISLQATANEKAREAPGFVGARKTDSSDSNFPTGTVLAFVHIIGDDQSVLFAVSHGELEPLAWLHNRTDDEEFLEANGGVESTVIARDVIDSLRKKSFSFVEDWKSALLGEHQFARCAIDYAETERYRSHLRK